MNLLVPRYYSFRQLLPSSVALTITDGGVPYTDPVVFFIWSMDQFRRVNSGRFSDHVDVGASGIAAPVLFVVYDSEGRAAISEPVIIDQNVDPVELDLAGFGTLPSGDPAEVTGTTKLEMLNGSLVPISRKVVAIQQAGGQWRVVGSALSDESDGTYEISGLVDTGAQVYLMSTDDLGEPFQPNVDVEADALIHPSAPNGYVYRVVTGGELPATEPDWWTTGQQQVGTATLEAREYLRPLAHGPVDVTFI